MGTVVRRLQSLPEECRLFVAGCDGEIRNEASRLGIEYIETPPDAASPAIRVAWAVRSMDVADEDSVIVVQGDEPMVKSDHVVKVMVALDSNVQDRCVNLVAPCSSKEFHSPNVVKAVANKAGYILYLSRADIPRASHPSSRSAKPWKQTGIFGFQWSLLDHMAFQMRDSELEKVESVELLRLLDEGLPIKALFTTDDLVAVDTPDDLEEVRARLQHQASVPYH